MKGAILAGGTGTRLHPLTKVTNKHLLPVGKKPMILHAVDKMVQANITDIMIVTGTEHMGDMISLLGSGKEYGCKLTYRVQDEPDGIAGALSLCEDFVAEDSVTVILGDNIFDAPLLPIVKKFEYVKTCTKKPVCTLVLSKVNDPSRFGVAEIINEQIVDIIEKPENPKSDLCVTGIYVYDNNVFSFIKKLRLSRRKEYEITDVNNNYISSGLASYVNIDGSWTDAGTYESYYRANTQVRETR